LASTWSRLSETRFLGLGETEPRAAHGDVLERDEEEDEDLVDVASRDAIRSAKVALSGIERSLAA
jgi:hypothetical protein